MKKLQGIGLVPRVLMIVDVDKHAHNLPSGGYKCRHRHLRSPCNIRYNDVILSTISLSYRMNHLSEAVTLVHTT